MSIFKFRSFRGKLFFSLLAASLIPLLICSMMMLELFRYRLNDDAQEKFNEYKSSILTSADDVYSKIVNAKLIIESKRVVINALELGNSDNTRVYSALFEATENIRTNARFDLYDADGQHRYSTHNREMPVHLSTDWGILYAAAHSDEPMTFVACMDNTEIALPLLQGASALKNQRGEQVGFVVVSVYQSDFARLFSGKYGAHNELVVMDSFWRPVYCAQPAFAAAAVPVMRDRMLSGQSTGDSVEDYSCEIFHHEPTGLYFALMQPQVFTRDTMRLLYMAELFCAVVCVVISIFTAFNLSRQLYSPISRLRQGMKEVVNNNLDVQVASDENDELGQLAYRFNKMVNALKINQQALLDNQKELDQAQIRMLQAQLNPHFLCNTLDTMKWISKINQVPQVAVMSTDLADILRFCISPDEFVPLWREAQILERYIEIQKIRLSDAFSFAMEIPEELKEQLVPKMILQPIVENAILHGIDGVENGSITVSAVKEGEYLKISVADDGRGLPEEMVGKYSDRGREPTRSHLGLYNVDTILQKHYGGKAGLYLAIGEGGKGAVVTAVLPIKEQEVAVC